MPNTYLKFDLIESSACKMIRLRRYVTSKLSIWQKVLVVLKSWLTFVVVFFVILAPAPRDPYGL